MVPTASPVDAYAGICDTFAGGQIPSAWQDYCDLVAATPAPVMITKLTNAPTEDPVITPTRNPADISMDTESPTNDQGYPATPSPVSVTSSGGNGEDDDEDDNSGDKSRRHLWWSLLWVIMRLWWGI